MIKYGENSVRLASWEFENTRIGAFCKNAEISFKIEDHYASVTELALQNMQGWIQPESIDWESDLSNFYGLFQPVILDDQVGMILSLVDREIVVDGRDKLIRMVISIENMRPHLRIQSEESIHSFPAENITGLASEVFQQIEGKVTQNVMKRISLLADYGIVSINLDRKTIEFGVTPIYLKFLNREEELLKIERLNTIHQIIQKILDEEGASKENFWLMDGGRQYGHNKKKQILAESRIDYLSARRTLEIYKEDNISDGSLLFVASVPRQVFVKQLTGKTTTIDLDQGAATSVLELKQKIYEKNGISLDEQRLIFNERQLENDSTLKDYGIFHRSELHLILRLRGGGPSLTHFVNLKMENQTYISFSDDAPAWRHVSPGLNLMGVCKTAGCPAKDKKVWVQKKFGRFNIVQLANEFRFKSMPKESRKCVCPICKESVSNVENCGLYNCLFFISGQTSTDKIERSNEEAPDDKLLSFHAESTNSDLLFQYRYLSIITTPKSAQEDRCIIL